MEQELILRYSHNIVEHLGLKLYQNQPTRVIAELISNSWDADSGSNQINMQMEGGPSERWVAVLDDGHGMTRQDLVRSYLVIGYPKRSKPQQRSVGGRPLMGRKGIGKLAAFGIARFVDVVTVAEETFEKGGEKVKRAYWMRFDRNALLAKGDEDHAYRPHVIVDGVELDEIPLDSEDPTGQISVWADMVANGSGTGTVSFPVKHRVQK